MKIKPYLTPIIGILGAGQLGKMLALEAARFDLHIKGLDKSKSFPAAAFYTNFIEGDFSNFDDVYQFGTQVDVLTIEIEHVNIEALHKLESEGVKVFPQPHALEVIQDKGLQKLFYKKNNIPSSAFKSYNNKKQILGELKNNKIKIPFVQKSRTGGYDGTGVQIIKSIEDAEKNLFDVASIIEPLVDIKKELAVIVARNESGEISHYPIVEMVFDPQANLLDHLISPAQISIEIQKKCTQIARKIIESFNLVGLLAVELFLTNDNDILVNEVAPRPHNSGHHTLDANITSQFEQHLRAIIGWPMGQTQITSPAAMVNLLAEQDAQGETDYRGWHNALKIPNAHIHMYSKQQVKPLRKMGHATVLNKDINKALIEAKKLKEKFRIKAKSNKTIYS